jgi:glutathione S-transferase
MLELYHYEPYANSMKCLICLTEKKLDFVSRYIDIHKFEQHTPAFVALNPNGQVPVLVHDGKVLVESTVVNEYLDDAFPEIPLRPADPYARARMRVWSKWVDEILMPSVSMLGWQFRFRPSLQTMDTTELEQRIARIPLKEMQDKWRTTAFEGFSEAALAESRRKIGWFVERMEQALAEAPWMAGETYSLADINTYPNVEGASRLCKEVWNEKNAPRCVEWLARVTARPGVQEAFSYSRFQNRPGVARDMDKALRAQADRRS